MRKTLREQVMDFHEAMGMPIVHTPTIPPDERVRLKARLIAEEFAETMAAMFDTSFDDLGDLMREMLFIIEKVPVKVDMVELADGLADLDYVVESARLEFGIHGQEVADEVQRTNMVKVDGPVRADGKRLKPEGWKPPDVAGVLREQGWRGS